MRTTSRVQAMVLVAVLLTACGGEASRALTDVDEVPAAVAALHDGSVAWEMSLDVDFDLDEIMAVADTFDQLFENEGGPDDDPVADLQEARDVIDTIGRMSLSGATDDEGDGTMAFNVDRQPAVEFAAGAEVAEAYMDTAGDPMAVFDADPMPMDMLLRVDGDVIGALVAELDDGTTQADVDAFLSDLREAPLATISDDPSATFEDLAAEMESIPADVREDAGLPDPEQLMADVRAVVEAAVNGDWFGLSGELDFAAMLESTGMTREMYQQQMGQMGYEAGDTPEFDPEAVQRVVSDALTYRDLAPGDDGRATATVGVDVETLASGYLDLMQAYDPMGMYADMAAELEAEELPMLEGVGTVTTQGTDVVEMRIDLLQVMAGFAQIDETISDQEAAEMRDAVASFDTTRAQLVISYSDHGEVGDLVDGLDAATLDVALIESAAALSGPAFMGGTGMPGGASGSVGQPVEPGQAPVWEE